MSKDALGDVLPLLEEEVEMLSSLQFLEFALGLIGMLLEPCPACVCS